ncbi:4-oxalomesaconate tautomerase, partial [Planktomarina temperata]|nr:4-oxalomesaconate tautomerase [Planktomarina temperata]
PKFGLLALAKAGGTIATRYFMPWSTHPSMAVTGAQCLASCVLTPGTIAEGMAAKSNETPANVILEHASGKIEVAVDYADTATGFEIKSAGLIRTARKIAAGEVFIPRSIWAGR